MASPTNGHEFEQALEVGDGQGGLACCESWGRRESDMTEREGKPGVLQSTRFKE